MTDYRSRLFLALLAAVLVSTALINMVVDRRALGSGGSELSWWSGAVLDLAVPVQKLVSVPFETVEDVWDRYLALIGTKDENHELRARIARLSEENLQLREALVAEWASRAASLPCGTSSRSRCCPRSSWVSTCRPGSARCCSIGAAPAASGRACR